MDLHGVAVGLADGLAELERDGQLVAATAGRHERAAERPTVDGASDFDEAASAEDGGRVGSFTQVQVPPSGTLPRLAVKAMSIGPLVEWFMMALPLSMVGVRRRIQR